MCTKRDHKIKKIKQMVLYSQKSFNSQGNKIADKKFIKIHSFKDGKICTTSESQRYG